MISLLTETHNYRLKKAHSLVLLQKKESIHFFPFSTQVFRKQRTHKCNKLDILKHIYILLSLLLSVLCSVRCDQPSVEILGLKSLPAHCLHSPAWQGQNIAFLLPFLFQLPQEIHSLPALVLAEADSLNCDQNYCWEGSGVSDWN